MSARHDTIFALSSGALPAAIAVVRMSGPAAGTALARLAGGLPAPRRATSARLRDGAGALLDQALILWLPGPATATGDDIAELHLHGGRATVAAVLGCLAEHPELRPAEPGEFTRRALASGRMDLSQVEGLADLLAAETEAQRRSALRLAEGGLSRMVEGWRAQLLGLSALVEAGIEFAEDEGSVFARPGELARLSTLADELEAMLAEPPAERLRDGVRIVIGGPVNAGKSSLLNVLAGREAAIASPVAGTTRDLIEVPVSLDGLPCLLVDGAGLRDTTEQVERIGVARARDALAGADLVLWLGPPEACPVLDAPRVVLHAQADRVGRGMLPAGADLAISTVSGRGMDELRGLLRTRVKALLPPPDRIATNLRQRELLHQVAGLLRNGAEEADELLLADRLRRACELLDRLAGRSGTEDMLDALFARFCIGK